MPSKEKSVEAAMAAAKISRETTSPYLKEQCSESWGDSTIGLLTNLRHLADQQGFDFAAAVEESQVLYQEEIDSTDVKYVDQDDIALVKSKLAGRRPN